MEPRGASDIDGKARGPNERDANESKLSEFNESRGDSHPYPKGGIKREAKLV
jgi:hypothetical protein